MCMCVCVQLMFQSISATVLHKTVSLKQHILPASKKFLSSCYRT